MFSLIKAHAYGNDFLYVPLRQAADLNLFDLARRLCDRQRGAGADGLILYEFTPDGATMRLINADGSPAEISGNGLRALAAIVIRHRGNAQQVVPGAEVVIRTDAGPRRLVLVERSDPRFTFKAEMGKPADLRRSRIEVDGEIVEATTLSIGNPHCVILGPLPDEERFRRLGPLLERHRDFPQGTNVEFAELETPRRLRVRFWERGVGPTASSGTGTCAAAAAAMTHGGASRVLDVHAPGGEQRVEWTDAGLLLTGTAELVWEGTWLADV
ncbi:MAG TPA: diaminopimelate epimerase [Vicinamibacterales bacterium]|nr:diaminopimelate epimerase [Vicinamibacterales bacterium]